MAFIPESNSVVAFQSRPSSLLVGASIMGLTPVAPTPASVFVVNPVSTLSVNITPVANQSVSGTVNIFPASVFVVNPVSTLAIDISPVENQSVSGVVGASIIGNIYYADNVNGVATSATVDKLGVLNRNTILFNANGSWERQRQVENGTNSNGTGITAVGVIAQYDDAAPTAITENQFGNVRMSSTRALHVSLEEVNGRASIVTSPNPASVFVVSPVQAELVSTNASIITVGGGSIVAVQGTTPWQVNVPTPSYITYQAAGSVMAVRTDNSSVVAVLSRSSVTALQGTNPWMVNMPSPSTIAYQLAGSVMAVGGVLAPSSVSGVGLFNVNHVGNGSVVVVGTYTEDQTHTTGDRGLFMLHVRNDTLSSVTSADNEYSTNAVGPAGETIVANAPITAWWQADTSIMANVSVQAVAPKGASIFTYVTGVQVVNTSPNNAYITFTGGFGGKSSVLGYVPAPTTGGAVFTLPNAWKTGANSGVSASVSSAAASVFISLQGFTSKT